MGETCSHVASLLWVVGFGVEKRDSLTVTQKSAYWVLPPSIKSVPYAPINDIKFIGKKRKSHGCSTHDVQSTDVESTCNSSKTARFSSPTEDEQKQFFCSLASIPDVKPAILSLVSSHCESYVPSSLAPDLPQPLSDLFQKEYLSLGYHELLELAVATDIGVTHSQVTSVES